MALARCIVSDIYLSLTASILAALATVLADKYSANGVLAQPFQRVALHRQWLTFSHCSGKQQLLGSALIVTHLTGSADPSFRRTARQLISAHSDLNYLIVYRPAYRNLKVLNPTMEKK